MIVVTTDEIPGRQVDEVLGMVMANSVRAKHLGKDIMAGFRNIAGGEITEYTKLMAESREVALQRMCERAEAMGANAIVATRFITAGIASGASEILVYGTAVKTSPYAASAGRRPRGRAIWAACLARLRGLTRSFPDP